MSENYLELEQIPGFRDVFQWLCRVGYLSQREFRVLRRVCKTFLAWVDPFFYSTVPLTNLREFREKRGKNPFTVIINICIQEIVLNPRSLSDLYDQIKEIDGIQTRQLIINETVYRRDALRDQIIQWFLDRYLSCCQKIEENLPKTIDLIVLRYDHGEIRKESPLFCKIIESTLSRVMNPAYSIKTRIYLDGKILGLREHRSHDSIFQKIRKDDISVAEHFKTGTLKVLMNSFNVPTWVDDLHIPDHEAGVWRSCKDWINFVFSQRKSINLTEPTAHCKDPSNQELSTKKDLHSKRKYDEIEETGSHTENPSKMSRLSIPSCLREEVIVTPLIKRLCLQYALRLNNVELVRWMLSECEFDTMHDFAAMRIRKFPLLEWHKTLGCVDHLSWKKNHQLLEESIAKSRMLGKARY